MKGGKERSHFQSVKVLGRELRSAGRSQCDRWMSPTFDGVTMSLKSGPVGPLVLSTGQSLKLQDETTKQFYNTLETCCFRKDLMNYSSRAKPFV